MRVVSWNMARNTVSRRDAVHDRAWDYPAALDPDMAFLQAASGNDGQRLSWLSVMSTPSISLSATRSSDRAP